jgi:hypothetical protein
MYIGSHLGSNLNYLSSGTIITFAFKKNGLENFERKILYMGPNFREVEDEILRTIQAGRKDNKFYNLISCATGFLPGVDHSKEKNGFSGWTHTLETKTRLSEYASTRVGELNSMYGRKHSEDSRQKMRDNTNHFGENNPMYGYKWSDEQREAQRQKITGKKHPNRQKTIVKCPHCSKEGVNYNMTRYHFDKCKEKR